MRPSSGIAPSCGEVELIEVELSDDSVIYPAPSKSLFD